VVITTITTITTAQVIPMDTAAMPQYNLILSQKIDYSQMTPVQGLHADTGPLPTPCSQLTTR
jgi:hypothetical protein